MQAITLEEVPNYREALEHGESFVVNISKDVMARLIPEKVMKSLPGEGRPKVGEVVDRSFTFADDAFAPMRLVYEHELPGYGRPKVGEGLDEQVDMDDSVFAPMTAEELKLWGL